MGLFVTIVLLAFFVAVGAHTGEPVFFFGFVFLLMWAVVACFARFVRWALGLTRPSPGRPAGHALGPARSCVDPRCGRVNVPGARFCGQCGRRLA